MVEDKPNSRALLLASTVVDNDRGGEESSGDNITRQRLLGIRNLSVDSSIFIIVFDRSLNGCSDAGIAVDGAGGAFTGHEIGNMTMIDGALLYGF
jgi:hypothetical protein